MLLASQLTVLFSTKLSNKNSQLVKCDIKPDGKAIIKLHKISLKEPANINNHMPVRKGRLDYESMVSHFCYKQPACKKILNVGATTKKDLPSPVLSRPRKQVNE